MASETFKPRPLDRGTVVGLIGAPALLLVAIGVLLANVPLDKMPLRIKVEMALLPIVRG